jgi:hypothetical protein
MPDASPEAIAYCASIAESTLEKCSNGQDDDDNGFTDCSDNSCRDSTDQAVFDHCAAVLEMTPERCSDNLDNDNNGFADCVDRNCRDSNDIEIKRLCQESYAGDPPDTNPDEANMRCSDEMDNDGDTFIDCFDWDCSNNPIVTVCTAPRVCE